MHHPHASVVASRARRQVAEAVVASGALDGLLREVGFVRVHQGEPPEAFAVQTEADARCARIRGNRGVSLVLCGVICVLVVGEGFYGALAEGEGGAAGVSWRRRWGPAMQRCAAALYTAAQSRQLQQQQQPAAPAAAAANGAPPPPEDKAAFQAAVQVCVGEDIRDASTPSCASTTVCRQF